MWHNREEIRNWINKKPQVVWRKRTVSCCEPLNPSLMCELVIHNATKRCLNVPNQRLYVDCGPESGFIEIQKLQNVQY